MAKAGRNEPCPCGSGKKFKRCCGAVAVEGAASSPARALHGLDEEPVREMLTWLRKGDHGDWLQEAIEAYFDGSPPDDSELQLSMPWALHAFTIGKKTLAARFLEERGTKLSAEARAWIASQSRAWLSVWEILHVEPGKGVQVRDLLTQEQRYVHEVTASRTLRLRDAVLVRIVDHDGLSTFCGMHPRGLPPQDADVVVRAMRDLCGTRTRPVAVKKLGALPIQLALILAWHLAVEAFDRPKPLPELRNSDGDPLLFAKDHYDFEAGDQAAVVAQLQRLEGAQEAAEREGETVVTFTQPDNVKSKGMDNTIVGQAYVRDMRLTLETNSIRRADDLRRRVEAGLDELVHRRLRDHVDVEALLNDRERNPQKRSKQKPETPPELQEHLHAFKENYMKAWVDDQIPALGGLTPREAAAKPRTRAQLELLLRDMENRESRLPAHERYDFDRLRKELRLPV